MKKSIYSALVGFAVIVSPNARATTLIIKAEKDRIILAADNRQLAGRVEQSLNFSDTACKIRTSIGAVYALSGQPGHMHSDGRHMYTDWDGYADIKTALELSNGNLAQFADEWGQIERSRIDRFIQNDPKAAAISLFPGPDGILTGGLFGFWIFGSANIRAEYVQLLGGKPQWGHQVLSPDEEVTIDNPVTRELIFGQTPRAREAASAWNARIRSRHYPPQEISWRHMQFLIEMTSKYDPNVSPTSDVVEITSAGRVNWLHTSACGPQHRATRH